MKSLEGSAVYRKAIEFLGLASNILDAPLGEIVAMLTKLTGQAQRSRSEHTGQGQAEVQGKGQAKDQSNG